MRHTGLFRGTLCGECFELLLDLINLQKETRGNISILHYKLHMFDSTFSRWDYLTRRIILRPPVGMLEAKRATINMHKYDSTKKYEEDKHLQYKMYHVLNLAHPKPK